MDPKFLSDSLKGVLVGGLVAMVLPAATLWFEWWKWRKEKRLDSYPVEMLAKIVHRCPREIRDAFTDLRKEQDGTRLSMHYLRFRKIIEKKLAEMDDKIEHAVP